VIFDALFGIPFNRLENSDHLTEFNFNGAFFAHFTLSRRRQRFADIDQATRYTPLTSTRWATPFYQQNMALFVKDNNTDTD
jgi:hypothetical protein